MLAVLVALVVVGVSIRPRGIALERFTTLSANRELDGAYFICNLVRVWITH